MICHSAKSAQNKKIQRMSKFRAKMTTMVENVTCAAINRSRFSKLQNLGGVEDNQNFAD